MALPSINRWLYPTRKGLYCEPGDFYVDPAGPVDRAVITHGHSDHARPGHARVLATPETVEIMKLRLGDDAAGSLQPLLLGEHLTVGGVGVRLAPAGHILGSAQVVIDYEGQRAVASGDYKRSADPTCAPFELVPCDVFITEATFALPVFHHEPAESEVARLLASLVTHPERDHLVGVYGLGKCQRLIKLCRQSGYEAPIYLHGALVGLSELYERMGVTLGDLRTVDPSRPGRNSVPPGSLVLCPPSAVSDRWSRRFNDPVTGFASGWMRIRGRVRQAGVELPLVISDHADWPELLGTISATGAEQIWVTHGREDALVYQLGLMGRKAKALSLAGFDDESE
jgi:putative mRNA 3-end processing factor